MKLERLHGISVGQHRGRAADDRGRRVPGELGLAVCDGRPHLQLLHREGSAVGFEFIVEVTIPPTDIVEGRVDHLLPLRR